MRPKGKLFALLAVFSAIALITATGAFTTVTAERTAEVSVAGDDAALLQLTEPSNIDEGAVTQSNGVATINLSASNLAKAGGINPDAVTTLTPLLNVTNQGEDSTDLNVTVTAVEDGNGAVSGDVSAIDASGSSFSNTTLSSGDTTQFGLKIDLTGIDQSDLSSNELTITIEIRAE